MTHDVRVLAPDELRAARDLFGAAIHRGPVSDEVWERRAPTLPVGRTLGVDLGGVVAGTTTSARSATAVPGGAVLSTAAVTGVGVRADRTRRGVLTALMRAQLHDIAERGEVLASLRASESVIYGRFGYGVASRARELTIVGHRAAFRAQAPRGGVVRLLEVAEMVPVLSGLHDTLALRRTGGITRWDGWWWANVQRLLDDREHVLAAVHTGPAGDDGFAVVTLGESGPGSRTLRVNDLHAADLPATAALWRFALDIDLSETLTGWLRPLDEPLELLLADPRACTTVSVEDETWLRIVDVPDALAARSYGEAAPVLIAVHDQLLERNSGVYRVADGSAEPVGPLGGPVEPELECDVAALAMAYLGDRLPSELVAAGWWRARDGDAVARADAAFTTTSVPWCGTYF